MPCHFSYQIDVTLMGKIWLKTEGDCIFPFHNCEVYAHAVKKGHSFNGFFFFHFLYLHLSLLGLCLYVLFLTFRELLLVFISPNDCHLC